MRDDATRKSPCSPIVRKNKVVAAEAALQIACARHLCRLTRFESLPLDKSAWYMSQPEASRPFARQVAETQHFQQLLDHDAYEEQEDNIGADAADRFCYRVPPPLGCGESPVPTLPDDLTWQLDPILEGHAAFSTRVYRYGTLADLLNVPVDDLWQAINVQDHRKRGNSLCRDPQTKPR